MRVDAGGMRVMTKKTNKFYSSCLAKTEPMPERFAVKTARFS